MLDLFAVTPDVYTFQAARELLPPELSAAIRKEARVARLPGLRQRGHNPGRWRLLLPYMPRYFASLDLRGYDLVISSSHACAVHVRPPQSAFNLCYCYTPMRYVWFPEADSGRATGLSGAALSRIRGRLQAQDLAASRRPDAYVAISSVVAERIRSVYGRDAEVIHPPVAVEEFTADGGHSREGFLWVHRLVDYKHPLEVLEAFRQLPDLQLTMVGVGPLEPEIRRRLPPNVELKGWLPRAELIKLFLRSAGFIHVGEEDFGISMVEALAAGTPVIALDRGGATDIVRAGEDGVLVSEPKDRDELVRAIEELASRSWNRESLRERASEFSTRVFRRRLACFLRRHGAT